MLEIQNKPFVKYCAMDYYKNSIYIYIFSNVYCFVLTFIPSVISDQSSIPHACMAANTSYFNIAGFVYCVATFAAVDDRMTP